MTGFRSTGAAPILITSANQIASAEPATAPGVGIALIDTDNADSLVPRGEYTVTGDEVDVTITVRNGGALVTTIAETGTVYGKDAHASDIERAATPALTGA